MPAAAPTPQPADAWPFLIARGRTVGRRVILAPDFLVSTGRHVNLQPSVARADEHPAGDRVRRTIFNDAGAEYTIFFTGTIATASMVGQAGGDLRDESSRRVEVTEGVLVAGDVEELHPRVLDDALRITRETFRAFWLADDRNIEPIIAPRLVPGAAAVDLSRFHPHTGGVPTLSPPPPKDGAVAPRGEVPGSPPPDHGHPRWPRLLAGAVIFIVLTAVIVLILASGP